MVAGYNIEQLKCVSDLAALIETIIVFVKEIIPPNANFEATNLKVCSSIYSQ